MEIINTMSGSPVTELIPFGYVLIFMGVLGFGFIGAALEGLGCANALVGVFLIALSATLLANGVGTQETDKLTPTKHEVLLREGAVIDATKYEIIEQRGKIYVIQEREASK